MLWILVLKMRIDELTGMVTGCCIKIHSRIGPGCLEKVYEEILYYELSKLGLYVERQVYFPIQYDELYITKGFRLDLFVEKCLPLELKSCYPLPPVFFDQLRTQLALLKLKNGMLLNFKVPLMKDGIHRVFNNYGQDFPS
jgi:GxxExxY protein